MAVPDMEDFEVRILSLEEGPHPVLPVSFGAPPDAVDRDHRYFFRHGHQFGIVILMPLMPESQPDIFPTSMPMPFQEKLNGTDPFLLEC